MDAEPEAWHGLGLSAGATDSAMGQNTGVNGGEATADRAVKYTQEVLDICRYRYRIELQSTFLAEEGIMTDNPHVDSQEVIDYIEAKKRLKNNLFILSTAPNNPDYRLYIWHSCLDDLEIITSWAEEG